MTICRCGQPLRPCRRLNITLGVVVNGVRRLIDRPYAHWPWVHDPALPDFVHEWGSHYCRDGSKAVVSIHA